MVLVRFSSFPASFAIGWFLLLVVLFSIVFGGFVHFVGELFCSAILIWLSCN